MKFFPLKSEIEPKIYAFTDNNPLNNGWIKVGYTNEKDVEDRIKKQYPTARESSKPYNILLSESAIRNDGTTFMDHDVKKICKNNNILIEKEWYKTSIEKIKSAIKACKYRESVISDRNIDFKMRPEQSNAVEITSKYFIDIKKKEKDFIPRFLWNAKMRFGKTFATYKLAEKMKWKKILILTFQPAVQSAWKEDIETHIDFYEWQFISNKSVSYNQCDKKKPIACFASFQDFLGKNKSGGIKLKNEWAHEINWDCVIFDEYHYGSWREKAKDLFEKDEINEYTSSFKNGLSYFKEENLPITSNHYLYLSGTPFRAISTGEFMEDQIFNWTYIDEQKAKNNYIGNKNPYIALPRMVMLTYKVPEAIEEICAQGEFNEFDLNYFFKAEGIENKSSFKHKEYVQKWLDFIIGKYNFNDNLKKGNKSKPILPFYTNELRKNLQHTLWFLPDVSSCYAMKNLLEEKQNNFFSDYNIVVTAGKKSGIGVDALPPLLKAMDNPLITKTITLSCRKLTTGVTVRPWTGIFILRNTSSPETYFQASFRVQSPWTIKKNNKPLDDEILKKECYIFDFSPNRALKLIADYSFRLNIKEKDPEKKVAEFINFLPILCYDGSEMEQLDPTGVLDLGLSGTTSTLLARRWEDTLLVNVDDLTLNKIFSNQKALDALMKIEGFRNLNKDIEKIINHSKMIKDLKTKANDRDLNTKEKKILSDEEKKQKNIRQQIREKLLKFATRIPIFMYLTDYREKTLHDIITEIEPGLFKQVTGLTIKDFQLLESIGVFNGPLMNEAILRFKIYEDPSLEYAGIRKNNNDKIGLWKTTISKNELNI